MYARESDGCDGLGDVGPLAGLQSWGGGVHYSDDWGLNWELDQTFADWSAVAVDATTLVVKPDPEPISYSTDDGSNFTAATTDNVGSYALVAAGGCFFSSGDMAMMRSCDGGDTWEDMSEGDLPRVAAYLRNPPRELATDGTYVYGFFGEQLYRHAVNW